MKYFTIILFLIFSLDVIGEVLPKTKLYAVTDGFCCGGEESDPHAVHGFEVMNNGFVLSGKSIELASRLPRVHCLALAGIVSDTTMGSPSTAAMWLNRGIKYWP